MAPRRREPPGDDASRAGHVPSTRASPLSRSTRRRSRRGGRALRGCRGCASNGVAAFDVARLPVDERRGLALHEPGAPRADRRSRSLPTKSPSPSGRPRSSWRRASGPSGFRRPCRGSLFVNGRRLRRNVGALPPGVFFEWLRNVLRDCAGARRDGARRRALAEDGPRQDFLSDPSETPSSTKAPCLHVPADIRASKSLSSFSMSRRPPASSEAPRMVHTRNLFTFEENSSATVDRSVSGRQRALPDELPNGRLARPRRPAAARQAPARGPRGVPRRARSAIAHAAGARSASHVFSFGGTARAERDRDDAPGRRRRRPS